MAALGHWGELAFCCDVMGQVPTVVTSEEKVILLACDHQGFYNIMK